MFDPFPDRFNYIIPSKRRMLEKSEISRERRRAVTL